MKNIKINTLHIFGLILLALRVCEAVKINKVEVPSTHILGEDTTPIVLDCIYDLDRNDSGFVLKWYLNGVVITQWIPSQSIFALNSFKGRVDLNYSMSEDPKKKYRALVIKEPRSSDSGLYSCDVQTFSSNDRKSSKLLIINPEDSMKISYSIENDDTVNIKCAVTNISPKPTLTLLFDGEERKNLSIHEDLDEEQDGTEKQFDLTISAEIKKEDINDDSEIKCVLRIPGSSYEKIDQIEYDENNGITLRMSTTLILSAVLVWLASLW